jgi:EAL domain
MGRKQKLSCEKHSTAVKSSLSSRLLCRCAAEFFSVLRYWRGGGIPFGEWWNPTYFIPRAERAGLIGLLTETILLQAFAVAAALQGKIELSVNISPVHLRDPSLPELIRRIAEQGAFPLNQLTVEVTENAQCPASCFYNRKAIVTRVGDASLFPCPSTKKINFIIAAIR